MVLRKDWCREIASMRKYLPIGVEFFDELIHQNYYYVDKTMMIADLLHNWAKVNLFTRPRRFGKSLNMSMLQNFFEIGRKSSNMSTGYQKSPLKCGD